MTTIVAVEDRGRVHIGSDSQASTSHTKTAIEGGKVHTVGPYTFGLAGLFEMIERLKRAEWPDFDGRDVKSHVVNTVIPFLLEEQNKMFQEFDIDPKNPFAPRSVLLLALKGRVFEIELIEGISPLARADGKYTVGSGSLFARGSLAASKKSNKDTVLTALEAAAHDDLYTSGPFFVKTVR